VKKHYFFLFGLLAISLCGCQNHERKGVSSTTKVETIEKQVDSFKRLTVKSGNANIYLKLGDIEALKIEAEENIVNAFNVRVENDTLEIEQKLYTNFNPTKPINFYVTAKKIESISLFGSEELQSQGNLKVDRLRINISGSGKADLDLTGDELILKILGSGEANFKGSMNLQKVAINGSANYNAANLVSKEAYIAINGSGNASVNAEEILNVKIFGSGNLKYQGNPELQQAISGSGSIESVNSKNQPKEIK
jgi:hypothetical protein